MSSTSISICFIHICTSHAMQIPEDLDNEPSIAPRDQLPGRGKTTGPPALASKKLMHL